MELADRFDFCAIVPTALVIDEGAIGFTTIRGCAAWRSLSRQRSEALWTPTVRLARAYSSTSLGPVPQPL